MRERDNLTMREERLEAGWELLWAGAWLREEQHAGGDGRCHSLGIKWSNTGKCAVCRSLERGGEVGQALNGDRCPGVMNLLSSDVIIILGRLYSVTEQKSHSLGMSNIWSTDKGNVKKWRLHEYSIYQLKERKIYNFNDSLSYFSSAQP